MKMLNEFVSVVISSNEEHRKLMEMTCLVRRQLPVALIEVPIFRQTRGTHKTEPRGCERSGLCVCVQYVIHVSLHYVCVFGCVRCVHIVETHCILVLISVRRTSVCVCWAV